MGIDKWFHPTFYNRCDYSCLHWSKLMHRGKVVDNDNYLRASQTLDGRNINEQSNCRYSNAVSSETPQLALRRWPNVGIGRHRRDRQPTSRQRWYSVACVATVCWHSVGARRLAYRSLPMFCVWTSVVRIKCFSNKCCRSTRLSIHQLHI